MKRLKGSQCSILDGKNPDNLNRAAQVIRDGGVVALPTETCFGLAVDPFNGAALKRLFAIKRRPYEKPVLVLIDSRERLNNLIVNIPDQYEPLMSKHWPGPLTLVFPALPHLPLLLTGGSETIAVRMSPHPVATRICRLAGGMITATSANISEQRPAHSTEEILNSIGNEIDCLVTSELDPATLCSTIVSQKNGELLLVRAGGISRADLAL